MAALALSTRHSTVRLQKVNNRVVVAGSMRHAPLLLLLLAERKCQLKLPFVNKWERSLQQTDDSSHKMYICMYIIYIFISRELYQLAEIDFPKIKSLS